MGHTKAYEELGITEKEFKNLLRAEKELLPLLNSLKVVEFELDYMKIDSPLYKAVKAARQEVEKIVTVNQSKAVATLLLADKNNESHRLDDKNFDM